MSEIRKTRLTREGLYYLAMLGFVICASLMREINLMIVLSGMMIGLVFLSWRWTVLVLSKLQLSRTHASGVHAGELFVVEILIHNTRRRWASWAISIEDTIRPIQAEKRQHAPLIRSDVLLDRLLPGQSKTISYRGNIEQRGVYELGPIQLTTQFPLGLVSRTVMIDHTSSLSVYPRLGRFGASWGPLLQQAFVGKTRNQQQQGFTEGDFYALRDWRAGDNRRWIHWRTSARRGGLMVRQFEQPRVEDFAILVDLWCPANPTQQQLQVAESALSCAATLVSDLCRRGMSQVVLGLAAKETFCLRQSASLAAIPRIMDQLTLAEADSADHLAELFEKTIEQLRPGMGALLVTTRALSPSQIAAYIDNADARRVAILSSMPIVDLSHPDAAQYFLSEKSRGEKDEVSPQVAAK